MSGAEILGIIAAAEQFAEVSFKTIKLVKSVVNQVQDAPDQIRQQIERVESLNSLAKRIQNTAELQTEEIRTILARCKNHSQSLQSLLEGISFENNDSLRKKTWRAIVSLQKEEDILRLFEVLDQEYHLLTLHITRLNLEGIYKVAGNMRAGFDSVDKKLNKIAQAADSSPDSAKCFRALFITNPPTDRARLITAKGELVDKTCDWITQWKEFVQWRDSDGGLLWISGGPGLGKTMLSIYLTEYLQSYFSSTGNAPHCYSTYFFCDLKDNTRNNAVAVARGLLYQLLNQREELFKYIIPAYQIQEDRLFQENSFETLWIIFLEMINDLSTSQVFCILDGLDECELVSLEPLLKKLSNITVTSPHLKIIVLSREYPRCLETSLNQFTRIRLDTDARTEVSNGLNEYISARVVELSESKHYPAELTNHVKTILREKSAGTYLWVSFVIKDLHSIEISEVETALNQFPQGLDALYEIILHQMEYSRRELILNILRWCAFAIRPLKLDELAAVLQIQPTNFLDEQTVLRGKLAYCGHFLNITNKTVTLVHQSAYDFLTRQIPQSQAKPWFSLSLTELENSKLASACISYLQNGCLEHPHRPGNSYFHNRDDRFRYSFFYYAGHYWTFHFRRSNQHGCRILDENEDFFSRKSHYFPLWTEWRCEPSKEPELVAAKFGLTALMQRMLKEDSIWPHIKEVFARAPKCTPLHLAVKYGHLPIIEILIKNRARINIKDQDGDAPLHLAVKYGHLPIIEILIKNRARINIKDQDGNTPLHLAVKYGHLPIIEILIKNRARINIKDQDGNTPLHLAVKYGHLPIVEMLIKNRARINIKNIYGYTPLYTALSGHHENAAEYLLLQGADVKGTTPDENPLMVAVKMGAPKIVRHLLERGADANIYSIFGDPLLEVATRTHISNAERVSLILLEYWSERFCTVPSKFRDMAVFPSGSTALHGACRQGSVPAIRLLLDPKWRLDLNYMDGEGNTPLHVAIHWRRAEAVELLLAQPGVDPSIEDRWGYNALHWALLRGLATTVQRLVNEWNMPLPLTEENNSWGAIHFALLGSEYRSKKNVAEMLQCLVSELGVNPQLRTFEPKSLSDEWHLYHFENNGQKALSEPYWDWFGPQKLTTPDSCSETPLSLAIQRGCGEAVEYFLTDCNVDPNASCRGCDGASPLHVAAQSLRDDVVEILVTKWNVNVHCLDDYQRTPLHSVANGFLTEPEPDDYISRRTGNTRRRDIVRILLAAGAQITARDNNGCTPRDLFISHRNLGQKSRTANESEESGRVFDKLTVAYC